MMSKNYVEDIKLNKNSILKKHYLNIYINQKIMIKFKEKAYNVQDCNKNMNDEKRKM